jgi:hypothetical protein
MRWSCSVALASAGVRAVAGENGSIVEVEAAVGTFRTFLFEKEATS